MVSLFNRNTNCCSWAPLHLLSAPPALPPPAVCTSTREVKQPGLWQEQAIMMGATGAGGDHASSIIILIQGIAPSPAPIKLYYIYK